MTELKPSPSPWKLGDHGLDEYYVDVQEIWDANDDIIVLVCLPGDDDSGEDEYDRHDARAANVNRILAVEEMYQALKGLVGTNLCPPNVGCKDGCQAAYDAIAKAEGEHNG